MGDIRPIETRYKGYRFRSRLEARWAVFFDTLNIEFKYEPEGFELPSGRYLPDFYLPELGLWCEVKAEFPEENLREVCDHICDLAIMTSQRVALLFGDIWPPHLRQEWIAYVVANPGNNLCAGYWWCRCGKCGTIGLEYGGDLSALRCGCYANRHYPGYDSDTLLDAFEAARSARFEFGEQFRG